MQKPVYLVVDVNLVKAEKKNEPQRMEEHLKFKKDCAQKAFVRGAEHLKSIEYDSKAE